MSLKVSRPTQDPFEIFFFFFEILATLASIFAHANFNSQAPNLEIFSSQTQIWKFSIYK